MSLSDFYNNFSAGTEEPCVMRLAEALAKSAPRSVVTQGQKQGNPPQQDADLLGQYTSLQVTDDLHFFSCDMNFNHLFQTSGDIPRGIWVGALFSGAWHTCLDGQDILFPSDGVPRLIGIGQPSRYLDQPQAKRRLRMASFLLADTFFDRIEIDDPAAQLAGLQAQIRPGINVQVLGQSRNVMENLQRLLTNPYRGMMAKVYVESLIMASVFDLARHFQGHPIDEPGKAAGRDTLAYEARAMIDAAPEEFASITSLAKQLGTNETSLRRQFRKVFGATIFEYVLRRRMQSARVLVRDGYLQISEISYQVGYRSPANFSTAYKRYFGHSPADDRG